MYKTLQCVNENIDNFIFKRLGDTVYRELYRKYIDHGDAFSVTFTVMTGIPEDGFRLSVKGNTARIEAADSLGLFAGAGRLLREASYRNGTFDIGELKIDYKPLQPVVGTYFATHFDNYYMKEDIEELAKYTEELALWGQNLLLVWFDMHAYTGMDDPAAQETVKRLHGILNGAKRIGMKIGFVSLANEGFSTTPDECRAEWWVQNGYKREPGGHYHVEICPNKKGGMELIEKNRRAVLDCFTDLSPDFINTWTYDQGGCTCEKCAPWGNSGYLKLLPLIRRIFRDYSEKAILSCAGWYLDLFVDGEWDGIYKAGDEHPEIFEGYEYIGGIHSVERSLPEKLRNGIGPGGTKPLGFPEISMKYCTPWGGFGANPYPKMLQHEWDYAGHAQSGEWCYSEGRFDDINKAMILGLHSGQYTSAEDAMKAYIRYEFSEEYADEIFNAIRLMEDTLGRYIETTPGTNTVKFHINNPDNIERIYISLKNADVLLPERIRQSWRWRIVMVRAEADYLLKKNDYIFNDECDACLTELENLYMTDSNSIYWVSPVTYKGLAKR